MMRIEETSNSSRNTEDFEAGRHQLVCIGNLPCSELCYLSHSFGKTHKRQLNLGQKLNYKGIQFGIKLRQAKLNFVWQNDTKYQAK